jgi:hypothetical protein
LLKAETLERDNRPLISVALRQQAVLGGS